jgi:hypothetical protein
MTFFKYSYTDDAGTERVQVNYDGFEALLSEHGSTNIEKVLLSDKQVKEFVRNANKKLT